MKKSYNESTPKIVGGIVLTGVALIAFYTLVLSPNDSDASSSVASMVTQTSQSVASTTPTTTPASTTTPITTPASASETATTTQTASEYKDGTYTTTQTYSVPHGAQNDISVELTVQDGTITAVSVDDSYEDHESASYIRSFESSVSAAVKGKKLSSLSVGRIGGASLTSSAFKKALTAIATQAKS